MGIEPTSPGLNPSVLSRLNYRTVRESAQTLSADRGYGFVAVFRQSQMGKWRDRTEALHAGNRTRTATAFATDSTPSLWWRITDHLRPIEIGVTNRIRTGTNAFTGRDAAVTS